MASGNTLRVFGPQDVFPPATLNAQLDFILGTSSPAEIIPVLAFDDTAIEYADFYFRMPSTYAGGGITLTFAWGAAATANTAVLSAALRRVADDAEDLDTTVQTYDYNDTAALTPANVIGEVAYDTLTFTNGADMDSVVAGDYAILRVRRVPTSGSDTLVGDLRLHSLEMRET